MVVGAVSSSAIATLVGVRVGTIVSGDCGSVGVEVSEAAVADSDGGIGATADAEGSSVEAGVRPGAEVGSGAD